MAFGSIRTLDGKRAPWYGLDAASSSDRSLAALDYRDLIDRAAQQRQEIEPLRVDAAARALAMR